MDNKKQEVQKKMTEIKVIISDLGNVGLNQLTHQLRYWDCKFEVKEE